MSDQLISLLERNLQPRVLVVGDVMLDSYLWGSADRISPEAPIPVVRVKKEEHRLGGAGNVAAMLATLQCRAVLAAVAGNDTEGRIVRELLAGLDVDCGLLHVDPRRMTTLKQRLLGASHQRFPQQMVRIDREDSEPIDADLADRLLRDIESRLDEIDLILVSDYNKGVCAGDFIPRLVQLARGRGVPSIADPVRGAHYSRYAGCACITPNRTEAGLAAGMTIVTPEDGLEAARRLLAYGIDGVAVTLDRDGIAWADQQGNEQLFQVRARQVCDVTGAGDMVLAALAYAFAAGTDYSLAMEMANLAGGLEVERLGVVPLTREELLVELSHGGYSTHHKIVDDRQLQRELSRHRQAGRRIAMTNGCFDLLHPGHVASLQEARKLGDCLVVGLNSDRSVRELKGPSRPMIGQQGRAEMLAALACVDYVVIFDEASVAPLIEKVLPDVLVKAAQYAPDQVVGHEIVESYGGQVVCVPMTSDYSTSHLITMIRSKAA